MGYATTEFAAMGGCGDVGFHVGLLWVFPLRAWVCAGGGGDGCAAAGRGGAVGGRVGEPEQWASGTVVVPCLGRRGGAGRARFPLSGGLGVVSFWRLYASGPFGAGPARGAEAGGVHGAAGRPGDVPGRGGIDAGWFYRPVRGRGRSRGHAFVASAAGSVGFLAI